MNEEETKEYIRAKRTPISSCVDLSKYFIGRHKVLPVYLTPQFEREFNSKMCQLEQLKEQLKISKRQSKEERYEYIASNFNPVEYSMKLEKYIINLEKENKKLKRIKQNYLNYLQEDYEKNKIELLNGLMSKK